MNSETFIFCLEAVPDLEIETSTEVFRNLEKLAFEQDITSIYKACDTIESLEESLATLLHDDHNFKEYEIIYLVMTGQENNICLNDYYYSLVEIAELFEGKLRGKIVHFANTKVLDLSQEEAQYFINITGASAISGYGVASSSLSSIHLDKQFFSLSLEIDDLKEIVEELYQKHFALCKLLEFRLYY